jgi:hypothetical protein
VKRPLTPLSGHAGYSLDLAELRGTDGMRIRRAKRSAKDKASLGWQLGFLSLTGFSGAVIYYAGGQPEFATCVLVASIAFGVTAVRLIRSSLTDD